MEPESPSPYPQVAATCPYPEPTASSPHDPLQRPKNLSLYYPSIYVLVSPMASFPQAFPPISCAHLYPSPYAPHALPISLVKILPPAQYWVRSTDQLETEKLRKPRGNRSENICCPGRNLEASSL
jgi:hypothetical protein